MTLASHRRKLAPSSLAIVAAAVGACNGLAAVALVDDSRDGGGDATASFDAGAPEGRAPTDAPDLDAREASAPCPPPSDPYWDQVFAEGGTWGDASVCGLIETGAVGKFATVNGELACALAQRQGDTPIACELGPETKKCPTAICATQSSYMGCPCEIGAYVTEGGVCPDANTTWTVGCGQSGRRPSGFDVGLPAVEGSSRAGRFIAEQAALEEASVIAFHHLADQLDDFGAPPALGSACRVAANDEARHVEIVGAVARYIGSETRAPVLTSRHQRRDLFGLACDNVVEGLVGESFAAAVAVHQAHRAASDFVRAAYEEIAADELFHAELSRRVHAWATGALGEKGRAQLREVMSAAIAELRADLARRSDDPSLAEIGVPDRRELLRIHARLVETLWLVDVAAA